jgi:hypothetical protein
MFALNFDMIHLFKFLVWIEGNKMIMFEQKNIVHEMFKFSFKYTLPNISIPNHISNNENHVLHSQSCYKQWTFHLFPWEKNDVWK